MSERKRTGQFGNKCPYAVLKDLEDCLDTWRAVGHSEELIGKELV